MLIVADQKIPQEAKIALEKWGELFLLSTEGIVYSAISGHPDIFIFQHPKHLILAPQTPQKLVDRLDRKGIAYEFGAKKLGSKYPLTTAYNVAYASGLFIGNSMFADDAIVQLSKEEEWLQSPQAYARCNTLILNKDCILTSEASVSKSLPQSLYVDPIPIQLKDFPYGFFGGCAGLMGKRLFLLGSLRFHPQGEEIRGYCQRVGFEIIELFNGPLFDGGGLFFIG